MNQMPENELKPRATEVGPDQHIFDLHFLGMGAGNSPLLLHLHERGLLQGKHIGIMDPDPKRCNDRTFCFWATEQEIEAYFLYPVILKSWEYCRAGNVDVQSLAPFRYYHVSGLDLYDYTHKILEGYADVWITEAYLRCGGFLIHTRTRTIHAGKDFDSRPPKYQEPAAGEAHLKQSFLGWSITCDAEVFDPEIFIMMDFATGQGGATQFMYLLPYDRRNALVECTRFGVEPVEEIQASEQLHEYINSRCGKFHINEGVRCI